MSKLTRRAMLGVISGGAPDPYNGADIVLDFAGVKNGGAPFYRRSGVVYASAFEAGFLGDGTFNSTGYIAVGTERIYSGITVTGDFIVLSITATPTTGNRTLWEMTDSVPAYAVVKSSGSFQPVPFTGSGDVSNTRIAFGTSGSSSKVSYGGSSVSTGATYSAPSNTNFIIGNSAALNRPWTVAVRLIELHQGTMTDAQIQALGA